MFSVDRIPFSSCILLPRYVVDGLSVRVSHVQGNGVTTQQTIGVLYFSDNLLVREERADWSGIEANLKLIYGVLHAAAPSQLWC